jgi:hypothetical protein
MSHAWCTQQCCLGDYNHFFGMIKNVMEKRSDAEFTPAYLEKFEKGFGPFPKKMEKSS